MIAPSAIPGSRSAFHNKATNIPEFSIALPLYADICGLAAFSTAHYPTATSDWPRLREAS